MQGFNHIKNISHRVESPTHANMNVVLSYPLPSESTNVILSYPLLSILSHYIDHFEYIFSLSKVAHKKYFF